MRRTIHTLVPFLLIAACADQSDSPLTEVNAPLAQVGQSSIVHRVTVGGPDICTSLGGKPGCDGNFSLLAMQYSDGSVTGQLIDQYGSAGGLHAVVDCINIREIPERVPVALEAWVGGVVTRPTHQAGHRIITRMRDNGTSANDRPDALSRGIVDPEEEGFHSNCADYPAPGIQDDGSGWTDIGFGRVPQGQVTIW